MGVQPDSEHLLAAMGKGAADLASGPVDTRVLVVEDHEIGLELTCMMVKRLGVSVDGATDGHQALRMIAEASAAGRPYTLVLMDFMMPVVDGIEATRRLRRTGVLADDLPVIALTACAEPREIGRFTAAGGQGYLSKPLSIEKLASVFEAWLPSDSMAGRRAATTRNRALHDRYRERKLATLERIAEVVADGASDPAAIDEIRDLLHKLAGTAGLFGDDALSEIAAECENALNSAGPDLVLHVLAQGRERLERAA